MMPKVISQSGFSALCEYVFKEKAYWLTGNMVGREPKELYGEFEVIRSLRMRVHNPAWHISLSAPHGERLPDAQWKSITHYFLERIGVDISKHQYFVMRHTDTEHEHIHSVVNRVGFNGSIYHNQNDRWKAIEICKLVEKDFGLKKTVRRDRERQRGMEREFGRAR